MTDAANYNLIDVLGIAELTSSDQAKAFRTIGQAVFESVLLRVMEDLDDEQKKEFAAVLGHAKNEEEILEFLSRNIPYLDKLIREETERFKEEVGVFIQKLG